MKFYRNKYHTVSAKTPFHYIVMSFKDGVFYGAEKFSGDDLNEKEIYEQMERGILNKVSFGSFIKDKKDEIQRTKLDESCCKNV